MRRYATYLLVLLLILSAGCIRRAAPDPEQQGTIRENIFLYYGSEGNEKLIGEEREIAYREGEDKYEAALIELINGPNNQALKANIPENTEVYGTIKQNENIIVNLSNSFHNFGGSIAEIVAVGSIVNTLTQFTEIQRVKILVEGEEYIGPSGEPRGFMEAFDQATEDTDTEVILYFAGADALYVVPEKRAISIPPGATMEDTLMLVLEELIKGPETSNLSRTIPSEVKVQSISIDENTANVDFSQEMHTNHWGGASGESMTINSVVNTLTEFEGIKQVKMTVASQPMNIEHAVLEEPVPRNEDIIQHEA